jgi:hypothetical protein
MALMNTDKKNSYTCVFRTRPLEIQQLQNTKTFV